MGGFVGEWDGRMGEMRFIVVMGTRIELQLKLIALIFHILASSINIPLYLVYNFQPLLFDKKHLHCNRG
jgi:hypothetical protein